MEFPIKIDQKTAPVKSPFSIKKGLNGLADDYEESRIPLEKAEELVSLPLNFPDFAENFFGKENIAELRILLESQVIKDIDILYLSGDITAQEGIEYSLIMNEVDDIFKKIPGIAAKMAETIEKKKHNYLRGLVEGGKIRTRGMHKILESFWFFNGINNHGAILSNILIGFFMKELLRRLLIIVHKDISAQYPDKKDQIINHFKQEKDPNSTLEGDQYFYAQFLWLTDNVKNFSQRKGHHFNAVFQPEIEQDEPEKSIEDSFRKIQELSPFRNVSFTTSYQGIRFKFYCANETNSMMFNIAERPYQICNVRVEDELDPKYFFGFTINRITGDLVCGNDLSYFFGEKEVHNLKRITFKLLLDFLETKEDDIAYAPMAPKRSVRKLAKAVFDKIKKVLSSKSGDDQSRETETVSDKEPEAIPDNTAEALAVGDKTVKVKINSGETLTIHHFKGISSRRWRRAFDALLGPAVRYRGSHHVYKTRSGGTYPIPLHDSHPIAVGTLAQCINKFGLSLEELREYV